MSNFTLTELKEIAESMDRDELVCSLVSLQTKVRSMEVEKKVLEEQIKQKDEWFEEINEILGVGKDEPAVEMVRDYVQKN